MIERKQQYLRSIIKHKIFLLMKRLNPTFIAISLVLGIIIGIGAGYEVGALLNGALIGAIAGLVLGITYSLSTKDKARH